jgi:hypothetical protein
MAGREVLMRPTRILQLLVLLAALPLHAQTYTRGVGVYPGDPAEDFAPVMELVTDGIRDV